MKLREYLEQRLQGGGFSTEDVLRTVLPLMRDVLSTHQAGMVAPLESLDSLQVQDDCIWFPEHARQPVRTNTASLTKLTPSQRQAVEVIGESRVQTDVAGGAADVVDLTVVEREEQLDRMAYLPHYVAWEHAVEHHDPLTDVFSLGMLLGSLACGLDFADPAQLRKFVQHRHNLFSLAEQLHPVVAQAIVKMTELDRRRRPQDLAALVQALSHYRDQQVDIAFDLARLMGAERPTDHSKQRVVLSKLRERLFELSRRNKLLHFRPTMQSVNLTHASMPLSFDIQRVRPDQILVWGEPLQKAACSGKPWSLNKYLNFSEALYLPAVLDRLISEARRDAAEYGLAQLRLVVCFMRWSNFKESPVAEFHSPLVLLPVKLVKKRGVRDTYQLEFLTHQAEINPVIRHQFKQLYDIQLPATLDLTQSSLDEFHAYLSAQIAQSEPAVTLEKIQRPRVELVHEQAKRRLDQYRQRARVSGRGVRQYGELDYSYDPVNYHPLGVKLFASKVRPQATRLSQIIEENPRPRCFATPTGQGGESEDAVTKQRSFINLSGNSEGNPYAWEFDLCSVTLANFRYQKMSLIRDYDSLLADPLENAAFDATFSLSPRKTGAATVPTLPLEERHDVVPCDPTQVRAIAESQSGNSYIIQGPPGTGKSQTITNLIADFVARGKRVLFVCEKRAAIDVVYARLKQVGLADLCCLIHDSQADKKEFVMGLKATYEAFLEDDSGSNASRSQRRVTRKLEELLEPISNYSQRMREPVPGCQVSVRALLDRCLATSDQVPDASAMEREAVPAFAEWNPHRGRLERFYASLAGHASGTAGDGHAVENDIFARHAWARLSPRVLQHARPLAMVQQHTETMLNAMGGLSDKWRQAGVTLDAEWTWQQIEAILGYAQRLGLYLSGGKEGSLRGLLDADSEISTVLRTDAMELQQRQQALEQARQENAGWRERLTADDTDTALEQLQHFQSWTRWVNPAWYRLRKTLQQCYDMSVHQITPTWKSVLERLQAEYQQQADIEGFAEHAAGRWGLTAEQAANANQQQAPLRAWLGELPDWLQNLHRDVLNTADPARTLTTLASAREDWDTLASSATQVWDVAASMTWGQFEFSLTQTREQPDQLERFLLSLQHLAELPHAVLEAIRTIAQPLPAMDALVTDQQMRRILSQSPELRPLEANEYQAHLQQLGRDYDRWLDCNAAEIRQAVRKRFLKNVQASEKTAGQQNATQKEQKKIYAGGRRILEHEFGKSMRYKPIRDLVTGDAGAVVRDLKPIWLMSPLSVSDTLPLEEAQLNVVVFDEASQITLETAIPSLFRAAQSIIVGDQMQLPPTSFFASKRSQDDEELLVENEGELVQYDLDSNSLLNHAARNLPSTMLGWHYRSRSEALITYSNWKFYQGQLLTVPDSGVVTATEVGTHSAPDVEEQAEPGAVEDTAKPGESVVGRTDESESALDMLQQHPLSFHYLEQGTYEKRKNREEADYVAHLTRELLSAETGLSLGIVAFSEAQQQEIEQALTRLAGQDADFAERLAAEWEREEDDQFVGLLVKNLENIQGDERDVIILSVCYGKTAQGQMRMNFGPINMTGGEKRLNVAFSRAKRHMAVVSSIRSRDITNDYNEGARCLKEYLQYAELVSAGQQDAAVRLVRANDIDVGEENGETGQGDALTSELCRALRQRGWIVDLGKGQSHFRVDLAVRAPDDRRYRLGILVDSARYYAADDLIDRELLRPKLLRLAGWTVEHVFAQDWWQDSDRELNRILAQLENAVG